MLDACFYSFSNISSKDKSWHVFREFNIQISFFFSTTQTFVEVIYFIVKSGSQKNSKKSGAFGIVIQEVETNLVSMVVEALLPYVETNEKTLNIGEIFSFGT